MITKTYKSKSNISISVIIDDNKHIIYVLKGKISELWYTIINLKNINKILLWCHKNGINKEILYEFINELYQKKLFNLFPEAVKTNTTHSDINQYLTLFIKENDKNFKYFQILYQNFILNNNILDKLYLQLSYRCNLHCKHCYNPKDMNQYEINYETAKRIIDEAIPLGLRQVIITSGECTINKDFIQIAKYIKSKYLQLIFHTNAILLYDNRNILKEVINIHPSAIQISLYSMNPGIHDYITGQKGSHKKTLYIIETLNKHNIKINIAHIELSCNKHSASGIKSYAKSLGIDFSSADCRFIYNPKNHNLYMKLNEQEMEEFFYENFDKYSDFTEFKKVNKPLCDKDVLCIAPNLDITACIDVQYPLGNYKQNSIKEIWENVIPNYHKMVTSKNLTECFKYEYCKFCSFCPMIASFENGILKKSKTLCQYARAFYKAFLRRKNEKN